LRNRVLQRAFERLELHEGKLSRVVLRGRGGGNTALLPGAVGNTVRLCAGRLPYFVAAFQYQADADRFYQELSPRLAKFGLELSAEKTRVLAFSAQHDLGKTSFDFLGFEFRWGRDRKDTPRVQRRTARKKFRNSLKQFTAWCQVKSRERMTDLFKELNAKLRGYYNYFGVLGNSVSLKQFFYQVQRILFKWLNRRSHKESYTWAGFQELLRDFQIEQPHLVARPKTSKMRVGTRA